MRPRHWIYTIPLRLRSLFHRQQVDQELDEELRYHVEQKTEEYVAKGFDPTEARRRAMLDLNGIERSKEECREMRKVNWLHDMVQDLRYGLRMLRKNPGFTLVAVLTLALGIGGTTAIFSLIQATLLRPLPFPDADRLVVLWERRPATSRDSDIPVSGHEFASWREHHRTLDSISLYVPSAYTLTGGGEPESVAVLAVSSEFFSVLGVRPLLGRTFSEGEDQAGRNDLVVLSHGVWQRRFAGQKEIIGRQILLEGQPHTVIGILPELPPSLIPDVVVPIDMAAELRAVGKHNHWVIARLAPGVLVPQAQSDLAAISKGLQQRMPRENTGHEVNVVALRESLVGNLRQVLLVLLGAVGFVLLIACANVANLLLTRAAARQREFVVRMALGAGRSRLIRQLLVESLLLAGLGGVVGLLVASWTISLLPTLLANVPSWKFPLLETIRIDAAFLGVAFALSLLTGVITSVAPAMRSRQPNLARGLAAGSRVSEDSGRRRLRSALASAEVGLALVLLLGAGLMINSFVRLIRVDPGFSTCNVLVVQINLGGARYAQPEQRRAFHNELLSRVRALPGVEAAGATSHLPLGGAENYMPFTIEGRPAPAPGQELHAPFRVVTPDYFRALRIPLRAGRFFNDADERISVPLIRWFPQQAFPPNFDKPQPPPVAIVSEGAARQFWPNENPLSKRIGVLFSPELTIVGVVGNIKHNALDAPSYPHIYLLHGQEPWASSSFVIRTSTPPLQLASAVRDQVRALDSGLPVSVKRMEDVFSGSVGPQRFNALVVGLFAAAALVLAMVGIFGVVSYNVAQRTAEVGLRAALGAQPRDILRLIIGQGMRPVLVGLVIGAAWALALGRFVEKLLFEVTPANPATFAGAIALMSVVALLACYLPARRAATVDPMVALRHE